MVPKPMTSCQLTVSGNSLDRVYVLYVYPYPTHVFLDIRVAIAAAVRFCDRDSPKAVLRSRTRPRRSICIVKKRTISHISLDKLELFPSRPALFSEADPGPGGRKRERKHTPVIGGIAAAMAEDEDQKWTRREESRRFETVCSWRDLARGT